MLSRDTGEREQVKEQEAVSPAGCPSGSRHLHLAAVPHASLGMEVMEEIPEGETFHFQARLEDPECGRGRVSNRSTRGNWGEARAPEDPTAHVYVTPCPCLPVYSPRVTGGGWSTQSVGFGASQPGFEPQAHTV